MNKHHTASARFDKLVLCLLFACAILAPALAFAPPPPPDPVVPAGNLFTEYTLGLGIVGYGAWTMWRSKRASKRDK